MEEAFGAADSDLFCEGGKLQELQNAWDFADGDLFSLRSDEKIHPAEKSTRCQPQFPIESLNSCNS
jgi:hypothetical protein